ncbi:hypothetical protein V8G54_035247 [Vigna mungo]|uniref:3'-5' exonuclease domain-containing protein n=1 Tax=Vigna mungo TaxID=3915 RepID=A0AAQ3RAI3_VIGMU
MVFSVDFLLNREAEKRSNKETSTMESDPVKLKVHLVTGTDTAEFRLLSEALGRSSVVGLDAEWKPVRRSFPTVSVVQIACGDWGVFVLDLLSIPLSSLWEPLRELLLCPDILKLGFGFKQDLTYLSSTFCSHGGFDKVEPYLDIRSVYNHLQHSKKHEPKQSKSLSTICAEVLGFSLSKELQCSDWSRRPLTEEQIRYAAMDAHCLLDIFKLFQEKVVKEGSFTEIPNSGPLAERDRSNGGKKRRTSKRGGEPA